MNKYSSYTITFRPRGGLSSATQEAIVKWLMKQDYYFAVTELEDDAKHLHAQIWLDEPRARGEVCTALQRIGNRTIENWDKAQVKVMRNGVKIAYSDWHIDYLQECEKKLTEANVLCESVPEDTIDFYPTEEEQEAVQAEANAVDKMMFKLERLYCDHYGHLMQYSEHMITIKTVQAFMATMMFKERKIQVITDRRRLSDVCRGLYHYLTKSEGWQACATMAELKEEAELQARQREFEASVEEARQSDN